MLRPPNNAHFETGPMKKADFLQGVLGRLRNDVGEYLDFVQQRNASTGVGIGFWGSIRLLMPVVEAVANVYGRQPADLLGTELDVKAPHLLWILYRHSLMHNDLLQHGKYDGVDATWSVTLLGMDHIAQSEVVGLDSVKLYNDLVAFLECEIAAANPADEVEIIQGVVWDAPNQTIKDEFNLIAPRRR